MTDSRSCTYKDPKRRTRCTECGLDQDLCACTDPDHSAHARLWTIEGQTFRAIRGELRHHQEEFVRPHFLLLRLQEQMGTVSRVMSDQAETGEPGHVGVYQQLIKLAAIAVRLACEGDNSLPYEPYILFPDEISR